jgi:diguanylate cyclase (GGDEF)-like protein
VDLDEFKNLHLKYGALFSNEVLRTIAEAVRQEIRESDLVGRFQTDSFMVLLPETPEVGAKSAAQRIHDIIASLVFVKKKKFSLRGIVVSCTVDKLAPLNEVISCLDEEMRKAQTG